MKRVVVHIIPCFYLPSSVAVHRHHCRLQRSRNPRSYLIACLIEKIPENLVRALETGRRSHLTFEKDSYIAPNWTAEQLEMVSAARRVIGYGGAFPPYEGLMRKFCEASGFNDAFELRPNAKRPPRVAKKVKSETDGFELKEFAWDLMRMGRDHQFPTHEITR